MPDLETLVFNINSRPTLFRFPAAGNMAAHIKKIMTGSEYPIPPLPENFSLHTVVDIGANIGAATLWFLHHAPNARVVCFEPAKDNLAILQQNLAPFPNTEIHPLGLFSKDKTVTLHLGESQSMQHSIIPNPETGPNTETITLKRASTEFDRLHLDHISILKIDTEGCEVPILTDLGPSRLHKVDILYLEWHSDEDRRFIDHLLSQNFLLLFTYARYYHRGSACYLNQKIANQIPQIAAARIPRPEE